MQHKFLSNLLLIVVLNLLVKPFYILGIDAEVQNRVGSEIYGNYFSILNFTFLLNILLDLGITNYNTRSVAQSPMLIQKYFYRLLAVRFILLFVYAFVTALIGWMIGYGSFEFYLMSILVLNQFLIGIIQFARSNLSGLHLFKQDAFVSILDRTLLIGICSFLLWGNYSNSEFKIEWFVYAQTFAYGLSALIAIALLMRRTGKLNLRINTAYFRVVLKQSFPYALLILLMFMYTRTDAVMLERLLPDGDFQAGIYAQGFRLLDTANMFAFLFVGLLFPIFARIIKENPEKNDKGIGQMFGLAFRIMFGLAATLGICSYYFSMPILTLIYTEVESGSVLSFALLMITFIPMAIGHVLGSLLTANANLKALNWVALGGVVLNVILNLTLIPIYKAPGAAVATLITQGIVVLCQLIVVYKIFRLIPDLRLYLSFIAFLSILIIGMEMANEHLQNIGYWSIILFLAISIMLLFLLKIIRISDLKSLLKNQTRD